MTIHGWVAFKGNSALLQTLQRSVKCLMQMAVDIRILVKLYTSVLPSLEINNIVTHISFDFLCLLEASAQHLQRNTTFLFSQSSHLRQRMIIICLSCFQWFFLHTGLWDKDRLATRKPIKKKVKVKPETREPSPVSERAEAFVADLMPELITEHLKLGELIAQAYRSAKDALPAPPPNVRHWSYQSILSAAVTHSCKASLILDGTLIANVPRRETPIKLYLNCL